MIAKCNFIPDAVYLREISDSGVRRVTLRKNFTEEIHINDGVEETHYSYEEVDVLVQERDNMSAFINANFENLFELGITQMAENNLIEQNKLATSKLLQDGSLSTELQLLGQQITSVMLGVM
jgi:hypothetical protein